MKPNGKPKNARTSSGAGSLSSEVSLEIDGRPATVAAGTTLIEAARRVGISIPTLCHTRGLTPYGACRVCLVEAETPRGPRLLASCNHPVESGMVVHTDSEQVRQTRRVVLELLLAQAPDSTELAKLARTYGVESTRFEPKPRGKCILCGLCVRVCSELMGRSAISIFGRGAKREVSTPFREPTDQCQACGACAFVCPTGAVDLEAITSRRPAPHLTRYDQRLSPRPCIDLAHPQASPRVPVIDPEACVHLRTGECGLCSRVCGAGAIDYNQTPTVHEVRVGAILLTPGFEAFDAMRRGEFGFGFSPNVITHLQFERMLSASGPTAGRILRPSDGSRPRRLAFVQCVGSRDRPRGKDYCSSVCCMAATKEAILAKEHEPGLDVTIFMLDLRAFGKDFDRYAERARTQLHVRYVRSFISRTYELPGTQNLRVVHVDEQMRRVEEDFDLIVLSVGLEPGASLQKQSEQIEVALNPYGFAATSELDPLQTSRRGVFVGGAFQEPKDIPDTVMQASGAAARAMALLAAARGEDVRRKSYPPERDISDEPARVGVFVCHCGSNIASVVDVARVARHARALPHVAYADHDTYVCADDSQRVMKDLISELHLNRVVVASCTPRTHEPIFRDTLREVGLNPYLLEMVNIRDQCSWVHAEEPEEATQKACDLVAMAAARAAHLSPLREETVPVERAALVLGGGIAGMTAALAMADQGFPVHLVEKEAELGGTARQIATTLDGGNVTEHLRHLIQRVSTSPLVTVHFESSASRVEGHVGAFETSLESPAGPVRIRHGVVVVATGATEQPPSSFGYGQDHRVLTQLELSRRLGGGDLGLPEAPAIVMIQCVEQRNEKHPYCSRVCCATAVKNALSLRQRYPEARILVLYRDMRTYGFREVAYRKAREQGIVFVRYDADRPPVLDHHGGVLRLEFREPALDRELAVEPDLVVLAAPIVPRPDRDRVSELLRVPLNSDGFFLEAHVKLRPVDFASEGLFLCGTAHAPKFISETISQANAVAGRAAAILSKQRMAVSGQTAWVDPSRCIACMTCVHVCPYHAPHIGKDNKAQVEGAVCMGCGSCTADCPAQAVTLRHTTRDQVMAAINGLLGGGAYPAPREETFPEQTGIARPQWH